MNYEGDENRRGGSVSGSGGRYNQNDQVRRGEKEWESPFSQIFLHTKQSINRVNEKYGTGGSLPARTGLGYNYASQPE